mmetsp:Transcript_10614/g.39573  ORF Transcript_10614/g.39573 Transcript_10614/m.39573 type:complete len:263 (+) Transcript_10614:359-1147(+)
MLAPRCTSMCAVLHNNESCHSHALACEHWHPSLGGTPRKSKGISTTCTPVHHHSPNTTKESFKSGSGKTITEHPPRRKSTNSCCNFNPCTNTHTRRVILPCPPFSSRSSLSISTTTNTFENLSPHTKGNSLHTGFETTEQCLIQSNARSLLTTLTSARCKCMFRPKSFCVVPRSITQNEQLELSRNMLSETWNNRHMVLPSLHTTESSSELRQQIWIPINSTVFSHITRTHLAFVLMNPNRFSPHGCETTTMSHQIGLNDCN